MKRTRPIAWGIIGLLIVLMIVSRVIKSARAQDERKSYSGIVSVSGFVLKTQPFTRHIEETGTLQGNKESMIAAQTGGQVMKVFVEVGDCVRAGEPLVRLDDELLGLEAERAKIAYDKARMDFERVEKLYEQKSISDSDLEAARLGMKGAEVQYRMAKKTYDDATIRAPFSGTVAARMTEVGQMIERGQPVAQLVDVGSLKLSVSITEADIKDVYVGAQAAVYVEALNDTFPGEVYAVGSRAMTGSRTFPVEIRISGNERLRSGMFARAMITAGTVDGGLLLPRAATLPDMGRTVVFVANGAKAKKVSVKVLGSAGDHVAISGLAEGDTVIVTGNQMLSQGSPINLTLSSGDGHDAN